MGLAGRARLRKSLSNLGVLAYGAYAWCVLTAIADHHASLSHRGGNGGIRLPLRERASFSLTRIRLNVHSDAAPPSSHAIIVANHSSYLDGAIIPAVVPARFPSLLRETSASIFRWHLLAPARRDFCATFGSSRGRRRRQGRAGVRRGLARLWFFPFFQKEHFRECPVY